MSASRRSTAVVAVGMPVYNSARWLPATIESILAQTFRDFVLIISDNASTDATADICARFAAQDPRIRYFRQNENVGVFRNYDTVFELSSSEYFKWASSNDYCHPKFLERCISVLNARPDAALVYPKTLLFEDDRDAATPYDDNLDIQDEEPATRFIRVLEQIKLNNVMNGVIRSSVLARTSLNRPHAASDLVLVAEIALQGKLVEVPWPLFYRRMTAETVTALQSKSRRAEFFPSDVVKFPRWKLELAFLRVVRNSNVRWRDKYRMIRCLSRRWRRNRRTLVREALSRII